MVYGIPYKGSKNNLCKSIIDNVLPHGGRFVDLFGGGGAMTHYAVLSNKFSNVHYNELDSRAYKLFLYASGNYTKEKIIPAKIPITKKRFASIIHHTDLQSIYELCVFSFGNDFASTFNWPTNNRWITRTNRIMNVGKLDISFSNLSYEKVKLYKNDVVYCDIPYEGTSTYAVSFDKGKFMQWCLSIPNQVFISERNKDLPKGF